MLINNITSAFSHSGLPVANGSVSVYTDNTTNQLANLTLADGSTPAPNPVPLNSNGGIGHPILTELSSAYCVVKNAHKAVLFGYHLTSEGGGGATGPAGAAGAAGSNRAAGAAGSNRAAGAAGSNRPAGPAGAAGAAGSRRRRGGALPSILRSGGRENGCGVYV